MQKYFNNVTNRTGDVVPGAIVTVTLTATGALATIYAGNGATPKANPITADNNGYFEFYAADGLYTLTITGSGIQTKTISDVLIEDLSDLTGGEGASLVGYLPAGTGAVARTVQAKLRESVSVKDKGAVGDDVADDTAAFTAAGAQAKTVLVPAGTYKLASTPTLSGVLLELDADAVLTGAGAAALGFTSSAKRQTLHIGTAGDDYSSRFIRRNASHTGGTAGFVSGALKAITYVGAGATNYEWAIVGVVDNSATAGENVGIYAQGIRRGASVGPTFGAVAEVYDPTGQANPVWGMVGLEVDCRGNGTDNNNNRIGIDVVVNKQDSAGAANVVAYGVRIQNGGDATATVKTAFSVNVGANVGFDTSAATITQAAYKLAQGQAIAFDANALNQLSYDGTGLNYAVSGSNKLRLNADGSIALNDRRLVIAGTWSTGAQTPTIGANKPGTTGGNPAQWLSVTIDGGQYWMPVWSN